MVQPPPNLTARLRDHVEHLAETIGPRLMQRPEAWRATLAYLEREMGAFGNVQHEVFPVAEAQAANLVVDWPAAPASTATGDRPGPTLVVGAHYDTVEASPGADDNASAVAALIEIGLMLRDIQPARPLRLIALANEENPHERQGTMGSQHHARLCRKRGEAVEMIALEMLGFYDVNRRQYYPSPLGLARGTLLPSRADFLGMVSNIRSSSLLKRTARGFRRSMDFPLTACPLPQSRLIRRSDHGPFWDAGYKAMMITDTSFLRSPHYHKLSDTPATLDYPALAAVTTSVAGAIERLVQSR